MDEHMAFEFGIVKELLATAFVRALKLFLIITLKLSYEFISVNCKMLFQRSTIIENFATRLQMTLKDLWLIGFGWSRGWTLSSLSDSCTFSQ